MSEAVHAVEEATEADLGPIAAFFWDAWREAGPEAPGWAGASDEALKELTAPENLRKQVGGPFRRMFIVREGEEVVGFASLRHVDEELAELAGIVIRQTHWGRGLGTCLMEAVLDAARAAGYRRIRVRTEADNERALRFYERQGFDRVERMTEEVGDVTVEGWELERPV